MLRKGYTDGKKLQGTQNTQNGGCSMYLFVAHYNNTELRHENEEIVREIELDEQQCKSELDVYVLAMTRAYKMKRENECLASLEFISC